MAPRALAVLLVFLFVALPAVSTAAMPAAVATGDAAQTAPDEPVSESTPVVENTTLSLRLQANGDGRWVITDTYALDDTNDTRAFEGLATDFTNNDTDLGWVASFRDASTATSATTGREMAITNVTRNATTTDRRGELVLAFTWTNFATANGSRLVVQDAFGADNSTWLPRLYANQTLVISPPPGYGVTSAPPTEITDGAVRFEGPRTFEPGYIDIVYRGDQQVDTPTATTPGPATGGAIPWLGAGVVLAIVVVVVAVYVNRQDDLAPTAATETSTDDGDAPSAAEADDDAGDDVDVALLSDEERVERLLEQNGGRMKQARIVTETGWSNAKVSQLLSSMDEADRIDKLRIGRENLISFPDEDVTEIED